MIVHVRSQSTVEILLNELLESMSREIMPPYVYTYPTKKAYAPLSDGDEVLASWRGFTGPLNLYLHVPFCDMKCSFCSLFATVGHSQDTMERYVEALLRELDLITREIDSDNVEVRSIYFGGGTPTVLTGEQLERLLGSIRARFCIHPDAELAIEGAPNSLSEPKCQELAGLGLTRISIGIQSFDDAELAGLGRGYEAEWGRRMVAAAIASGFPNVNLDLIYGLRNQTEEGWRRNLEIALELGPPTLTLYPLVVRQRTTYGKALRTFGTAGFPDDSTRYAWYDLALEILAAHGYEQHTLVTFARRSGGCRHEANEFLGVPTLGLGAGARSYAPRLHYTNDDYAERRGTQYIMNYYLDTVEADRVPVNCAVALELDDVLRRYMILGLLYRGIERQAYRSRFGESVEERFGAELEALELAGCLADEGAWLRLTPLGKRFSSLIAEMLAEPGAPRESAYA